jgi:hypothetical protein
MVVHFLINFVLSPCYSFFFAPCLKAVRLFAQNVLSHSSLFDACGVTGHMVAKHEA